MPGTFPTFIVDDQWVVKFFGRLFEGEKAFAAEFQANQIISGLEIAAPALLLQGRLIDDPEAWRWPYLVFEYLPAISIGEVYEQVSFEDKLLLARKLGHMTHRLHSFPLDTFSASHPAFLPDWNPFIHFLEQAYQQCLQNQRNAGLLPSHLLEQVQEFVFPPEELVDLSRPPHLIHADLTRDHILGTLENGGWETKGIIDWGDAMTGNFLYELLALHLDLFHCDKRLLKEYLDAYGLEEKARQKIPGQAMSLALIHRFNVMEPVFRDFPNLRTVPTLAELASILWEV